MLNDILIGEVWICSGQSNMEMPVHGFYGQPVAGSLDEIFEAKQYSGIRMFTVPPTPAKYPQENCGGAGFSRLRKASGISVLWVTFSGRT